MKTKTFKFHDKQGLLPFRLATNLRGEMTKSSRAVTVTVEVTHVRVKGQTDAQCLDRIRERMRRFLDESARG